MQVHPTRTSVDIAITGIAAVAIGLLLREAAIVAWSGSLLLGLAVARAVTQIGVARIRGAGFEMLWRGEARSRRIVRGESIEIEAEIRNRDQRAARFTNLRAVASPELSTELSPTQGEVPAGGRLRVTVKVSAPRVGRHGIHGLSLEVQGGPGLFEVPLTFANPYVLEVMPRPFSMLVRSARGGRSRRDAEVGRAGPLAGEGDQLRELREHHSGDPFRRIAWKASAKRGVLLVREYEREERDVVWLLLDASVELWAGTPGRSALDSAIDEVAACASRHLSHGDSVGLAIIASRRLVWLKPDRGPSHSVRLMEALAHNTSCLDADRSGLDEADVAARVLEHMRPLDPAAANRVMPNELDRIARRADKLRARAPFPSADAYAQSKREKTLRRYFAAFGISSPARLEPDRSKTDPELARALNKLKKQRPMPSLIYVWSPAPDPAARPTVERALVEHPRRRIELRWVAMKSEAGISSEPGVAEIARDALSVQARAHQERGERALRHFGIRIERVRPLYTPSVTQSTLPPKTESSEGSGEGSQRNHVA